MKKLMLIFILVLLTIGNFLYHKQVYSFSQYQDSNYPKFGYIKNDYEKFFYRHDATPLLIFKDALLDKYAKYSFLHKKSGLVFPHQELIADLKYIQDIQYLGSFRNTFEAKYLYNELNYISDLSPYRNEIYTLGLRLLPASRETNILKWYEKLRTWHNATKLGEKGIFFTCDKNKIQNILSLPDNKYLQLAYSKNGNFYKQNSNPCQTIELPETLGFDYFYYLRDLKNSIKNYKIAGFMKDALPGVIGMVGVINGMLGQHEKAMYLLLNKADSLLLQIKKAKTQKQIKILSDMLNNTIKRAQEELNFYIISQADSNHPECNKNYQCLVKNGYIKQEIQKLENYCSKHFDYRKITSLDKIFSSNIQNSVQTAKCFLLGINLSNGNIKNYQLIPALIKNGTYYYNQDLQTWWVKK